MIIAKRSKQSKQSTRNQTSNKVDIPKSFPIIKIFSYHAFKVRFYGNSLEWFICAKDLLLLYGKRARSLTQALESLNLPKAYLVSNKTLEDKEVLTLISRQGLYHIMEIVMSQKAVWMNIHDVQTLVQETWAPYLDEFIASSSSSSSSSPERKDADTIKQSSRPCSKRQRKEYDNHENDYDGLCLVDTMPLRCLPDSQVLTLASPASPSSMLPVFSSSTSSSSLSSLSSSSSQLDKVETLSLDSEQSPQAPSVEEIKSTDPPAASTPSVVLISRLKSLPTVLLPPYPILHDAAHAYFPSASLLLSSISSSCVPTNTHAPSSSSSSSSQLTTPYRSHPGAITIPNSLTPTPSSSCTPYRPECEQPQKDYWQQGVVAYCGEIQKMLLSRRPVASATDYQMVYIATLNAAYMNLCSSIAQYPHLPGLPC